MAYLVHLDDPDVVEEIQKCKAEIRRLGWVVPVSEHARARLEAKRLVEREHLARLERLRMTG